MWIMSKDKSLIINSEKCIAYDLHKNSIGLYSISLQYNNYEKFEELGSYCNHEEAQKAFEDLYYNLKDNFNAMKML